MSDKLYLKDLPCFTQSPWYSENGFFNLGDTLPDSIRSQIRAFIIDRARHHAFSTLANDRIGIAELIVFLSAEYPSLKKVTPDMADELEKGLKKYLLTMGKPIGKTVKSHVKNDTFRMRRSIVLLRELMTYIARQSYEGKREEEKDVWELDRLPFEIRQNPVHREKTINFSNIIDIGMREEIKQVCFLHLHYQSVSSVETLRREGTDLANFLAERHFEIHSLNRIDREMIEAYFLYRRTAEDARHMHSGTVSALRSLLTDIAKMYGEKTAEALFVKSDYPKEPVWQYRAYSDAELERIHAAVLTMPKQMARCIFLQELLGTRISEVLTLAQDCLEEDNGSRVIRINQIKTDRCYRKGVNDTVVALIEASVKWTKERYGVGRYIFSKAGDPDVPMAYSTIAYALTKCFHDKEVCDDAGVPLSARTHMFRKTYGQRLTDMGMDDATIAKLLGHASQTSVYHYRKISPAVLADATEEMRRKMDDTIKKISAGWE